MPRALTLGNGDLLVNFDGHYNLIDIYWPWVGRENQTDGHACRLGVCADGQFAWLEELRRTIGYEPDTLVSRVGLVSERLGLRIACADAVDFHEPLLLR